MGQVRVCRLEGIRFDDLIDEVKSGQESGRTGCIVSFIGIVKEKSGGGIVERLDLVMDDKKEEQLQDIADEVSKKYDVINLMAYHNLDKIESGKPIIYILASAEHRDEAFKAVQEFIDRMKNEVHIGLKEVFKDEQVR